jgi:NAD(P)-dependent dehydrogenase (short-subunit alcohol dehydrogenase family)
MAEIKGMQTLVTGAATEVGRAVVRAFVESGARVIAVDTTDEEVERAIDELGLADADEVITRGLDDRDLGSWWDLSNLIAAFYHELDALVHIPQGTAGESLPFAVDRLKESLAYADLASPGAASIVLLASAADETAKATLEDVASRLAEEGSGVCVSALEQAAPNDTAAAVVERVSSGGDSI